MRNRRSLITIGLILAGFAARSVAGSPGDDPKPNTPLAPPTPAVERREPIYLFLNAPTDFEAFWKLISRPDQVVLDGGQYRKLLEAEPLARSPGTLSTAVIQSLTATGRVSGDWAHLTLDFRVVLEADQPEWVAIRLDGLTLTEAREGDKDLPTRIAEDRGWQVELRGKGEHQARVGLIVPIRSTVEGKRIDVPIPPVASTGIDLDVPETVLDASTGINEKLAVAAGVGKGSTTRLQARLSPRTKLEVAWRERADPAAKLPPLLEATGDVAIDIERDSILTRSTWVVTAVRGTVGQITIRLDTAEEVFDVLIEGRPVLVETRRESGRSVVAIPLAEPLRPGTSRSVTLSTRRPIPSNGAVRAVLEGYSFDQAKVQAGMIAVSRAGPLFLNPISSRGLRRIDPRTELPDSLRNRADTVLAYEFNGPPYELGLSIEPAPPRLQVEERTTVTIEPRSARVQSRLDCRTSQGRVYEIQVILPKGLDFESAEPADVVAACNVVPLDRESTLGVGIDVPRILSISLKPKATEDEAFAIVLKGWCAIDPTDLASVALFRPVVDSSHGSRFAVVTDRNVSVELPQSGELAASFRVVWGQPPADWVWPVRKPGPEQGVLWLRSDSNPEILPLKTTVRSRSIRHETTLTATIDRRGAEVVEEIAGEVSFGALSKLDLAVPREIGDRWDVEGVERAIREPLETEADGSRRYRLRFPRDYPDTFRIRIRYRLPFARLADPETPGRLALTPIRVLEGTSTGRRVLIAADPAIEVETEAKGWSVSNPNDLTGSSENTFPIRISLTRQSDTAGPVVVTAKPGPRMPLPSVVVSRLWLKTVQRPDNDLATTAYLWVEARDGPMVVGLDPGTRWVRARVGTTELAEGSVDLVAADEYRIRFPASTPTGPILMAIEMIVPARNAANGWPALRLLGGVIQQTVWEAQLLGTRAGVGTPSGWLDENEWYWDGLIWQRRPWRSPLELANWLTGGSSRYKLLESMELEDRGNRHSYLFSRVGPPSTLRFSVFSRFTLLLLCSGPVLLAGLFVLSRRPPPRLTASLGLVVAFAVGALVEPNALVLILQSSVLGVFLFLTALVIHWLIERRTPFRAGTDLGMIVSSSSAGSTFDRSPGVGSDDSTAIRIRPLSASAVSTADHIVLTRPLGRPIDELPPAGPDLR